MHLLFSTICEQSPLHIKTSCLKVKPTFTVWMECQNWDIKKLMADTQRGTERLLNGTHKSGSLAAQREVRNSYIIFEHHRTYTHTHVHHLTLIHTHVEVDLKNLYFQKQSPHTFWYGGTYQYTHTILIQPHQTSISCRTPDTRRYCLIFKRIWDKYTNIKSKALIIWLRWSQISNAHSTKFGNVCVS